MQNNAISAVPNRVRAEVPLTELNDLFVQVQTARRVQREGQPDKKDKLLGDLLSDIADRIDGMALGFLSSHNM